MSVVRKLVIIPAREGSKRIVDKNIRDFNGLPMLAHPLKTCLESRLFDEVMVSTDSEKIAQIAKEHGASVPFLRSEENSGDFASTGSVIKEVLENYSKQGKEFDYVFCVYPAAVNIQSHHLKEALDVLDHSEIATSLITTVRPNIPYQIILREEDGLLHFRFPEYKDERTQDLEESFFDAGQFYIAKKEHFFKTYRFMEGHVVGYELPSAIVQDIDTEDDLEVALIKHEMMLRKLNQ